MNMKISAELPNKTPPRIVLLIFHTSHVAVEPCYGTVEARRLTISSRNVKTYTCLEP
jgi:hypothetical protein